MEVIVSARKHGLSDADILHAWRNVMRTVEQDYGGETRLLAIGPAWTVRCWSWSSSRPTTRCGSSTLTGSARSSTTC